jgi:hypothetical protein
MGVPNVGKILYHHKALEPKEMSIRHNTYPICCTDNDDVRSI